MNTERTRGLINGTSEGFDNAWLFRSPPTSFQKGYADLALGGSEEGGGVHYHWMDDITTMPQSTICFAEAYIPGAALYLGDGLVSSLIFREMAAFGRQGLVPSVRVAPHERNLITIFGEC